MTQSSPPRTPTNHRTPAAHSHSTNLPLYHSIGEALSDALDESLDDCEPLIRQEGVLGHSSPPIHGATGS